MRADLTLSTIRDYLTGMERSAQNEIDRFNAKMQTEPYHALEWADAVFMAAAKLDIARAYLGRIAYMDKKDKDEYAVGKVRSMLMREFAYAAGQNAAHSTSVSANYLNACRAAVYAQMYEMIFAE